MLIQLAHTFVEHMVKDAFVPLSHLPSTVFQLFTNKNENASATTTTSEETSASTSASQAANDIFRLLKSSTEEDIYSQNSSNISYKDHILFYFQYLAHQIMQQNNDILQQSRALYLFCHEAAFDAADADDNNLFTERRNSSSGSGGGTKSLFCSSLIPLPPPSPSGIWLPDIDMYVNESSEEKKGIRGMQVVVPLLAAATTRYMP